MTYSLTKGKETWHWMRFSNTGHCPLAWFTQSTLENARCLHPQMSCWQSPSHRGAAYHLQDVRNSIVVMQNTRRQNYLLNLPAASAEPSAVFANARIFYQRVRIFKLYNINLWRSPNFGSCFNISSEIGGQQYEEHCISIPNSKVFLRNQLLVLSKMQFLTHLNAFKM